MSRYVHGHHESVLRSHRARTAANSAGYLLPHLAGAEKLLDVGSGPGTITCDLAALVGHVTAVENTADAAALTEREKLNRGLTNVSIEVADVHGLPFADGSFDVVHAHQVLQHVADPVQALREMKRVTRPGAVVAVRDSDYSGFFWQPVSPELDDWLHLYRGLARATGGEPDAGRWLPVWAAEAGLRDVTVTVTTWCYTSDQDRAWWSGLWQERVLRSDFAARAQTAGVTSERLQSMSDGWREWGQSPHGLFAVPSVELLARV